MKRGKKYRFDMDRDMRQKISGVASGAKSRARKKGLDFEDDLFALALKLYGVQGGCCALTGVPFNLREVGSGKAKRPFAPSLDRIDPTSGYTRENIRLVCQLVNFALNSYGEDAASKFDPARVTPLPEIELQLLTGAVIAPNDERERKQSYIEHIVNEAPKILRSHGGCLEKTAMRDALRSSFAGELPIGEANAYGWGFRRLTEAGVIQPTSKSNTYSLIKSNYP